MSRRDATDQLITRERLNMRKRKKKTKAQRKREQEQVDFQDLRQLNFQQSLLAGAPVGLERTKPMTDIYDSLNRADQFARFALLKPYRG